jgi:pimeloyl-ACP methyl ester carboxylesterase
MELRRGDGSVIAVDVVGEQDASPVLLCHGLADSRLSADWFGQAARDLGLCVIAPDRPGTGGTDLRQLRCLADWVEDAVLVLDALRADAAALLGISGGGPFAAACAARIPGRARGLTLVSPLGLPSWPIGGMAAGERLSLGLARHAPAFGGWSLGRLAALARRWPRLFLRLVAAGLPDTDTRALQQPDMRESFLTSYVEAFRHGSEGVAQDLRVLTRPWGECVPQTPARQMASLAAPSVFSAEGEDISRVAVWLREQARNRLLIVSARASLPAPGLYRPQTMPRR